MTPVNPLTVFFLDIKRSQVQYMTVVITLRQNLKKSLELAVMIYQNPYKRQMSL